MFKWILAIVLAVGMLYGGPVFAQEGEVRGGLFYDLNDCHTTPIVNYTLKSNGGFNLDFFIKKENNDMDRSGLYGFALTYDLKDIVEKVGISLPEFIDLRAGYAATVNQLIDRDSEFHHGIKGDIVKFIFKF